MAKDVCRICLEESDLHPLFGTATTTTPASKIMIITNVKITENDNLPQYICKKCLEKVEKFLEFKLQIESTNEYLRSLSWDSNDYERTKSTSTSVDDLQAAGFIQEIDVGGVEQIRVLSNFQEASTIKTQNPKSILTIQTSSLEFISSNLQQENVDSRDNIADLREGSDVNQSENRKGSKYRKAKEPIQCSICGKLISSRFRLKCHIRIHTGEKPYKCNSCDKSFSVAYNLKMHQRTHTGEKPLECNVCRKKFAAPTGLISHLRLHTGESPYKCHLCPKEFKTNSHLKYHIQLHTGAKNFVCPTCNKAFVGKSDLTQHLKIHTGERPHVCTVCGMRMARAYHLDRHMLTHSGLRKFKCELCGLAYAQKYDLTRHMKVHNKTKSKETIKDCVKDTFCVKEFLCNNVKNESKN